MVTTRCGRSGIGWDAANTAQRRADRGCGSLRPAGVLIVAIDCMPVEVAVSSPQIANSGLASVLTTSYMIIIIAIKLSADVRLIGPADEER